MPDISTFSHPPATIRKGLGSQSLKGSLRASEDLTRGHHPIDRDSESNASDGMAAWNGVLRGGVVPQQARSITFSAPALAIGGRVAPPPYRQQCRAPRAAPAQSSPSSAFVAIRCVQARSSRGDGQSADGCGGEGGRRGCALRSVAKGVSRSPKV